jgi:hypothetical protein
MNHVTNKTLAILGGVVLLALIAALTLHSGNEPQTESRAAAQPVLPDLRDHLNDIASVSFTGAGEKPIATFEKGAAGWTVKERGGYPADTAKLREFLLKLSDATLEEAKTSSEKHYAELGVDDVKAADAKGVLVALVGLPKPTQLIVGIANARGAGTYVRRAGESQSWLAKGNISIDKSASNWLDKGLADIAATRIKEVALTSPEGKVLRVVKDQSTDANFKVSDVPKGRELSSEFAANGLGTALAGLRFDDVVANKDAEPPADGKVNKAHYVAFDGLAVDAIAWKKDDKAYARFTVNFDAAAAEPAIVAQQAKAKADWELQQKDQAAKAADAAKTDNPVKPADATPPLAVSDPAKDKQQRLDALNKEVADLRQRFEGWTYVLPAFRFDNFAKGMDDMLKSLEAKKDDKAKPATPKSIKDALPGNH